MREPDDLSAKRAANATRDLLATAAWQGDWPPARKLAYRERMIERLGKQHQQRLGKARSCRAW